MRCRSVADAVREMMRIIENEKKTSADDSEIFFRGVKRNWYSDMYTEPIGASIVCGIDRNAAYIKAEREMFQEAMRYNVASFKDDATMNERLTRMQHYSLPTRFADLTINFMQGLLFAVGGCDSTASESACYDGFVRIIKVAKHKLKSFTSDIIVAISHLPLVDADKINPNKKGGLDVLRYEIMKERGAFGFEKDNPSEAKRLRKEIQQVWAFKPMLNNERIRNQGGLFLAFGCGKNKQPLNPSFSSKDYLNPDSPSYGIKQIGAVQIAADCKTKIRNDLRMFGMQEEVVYPDMSEVCKVISSRFQ
jgi:hypothetical protein